MGFFKNFFLTIEGTFSKSDLFLQTIVRVTSNNVNIFQRVNMLFKACFESYLIKEIPDPFRCKECDHNRKAKDNTACCLNKYDCQADSHAHHPSQLCRCPDQSIFPRVGQYRLQKKQNTQSVKKNKSANLLAADSVIWSYTSIKEKT